MSKKVGYLMESSEESTRLDKKTKVKVVQDQAMWAGIKPGMRVADIGCGSGKTTFTLHKLVQPEGETIGIDISKDRIKFARNNYETEGLTFHEQDARELFSSLGKFDFIWMRFVLEYYREGSFSIVEKMTEYLNPGGVICLIDLDHNCLSHYSMPVDMETTVKSIVADLEKKADFDPYVGRKLYSFLYDLKFQDIDVNVSGHHVIFGSVNEADSFNWLKKIKVAPEKIKYDFSKYKGGYEQFVVDFQDFFHDPRRFTYSPIICCRGVKPQN